MGKVIKVEEYDVNVSDKSVQHENHVRFAKRRKGASGIKMLFKVVIFVLFMLYSKYAIY